ncbi:hypothetical protein [Acinetobacter rudis]|uniref:Uncharacterized protein n=1 Tax=Acinetobacter rudis TaxID=632955 RepID=A0AAW8J9A0_9GAMM|nr:hypothetical protein [Acinetobacter rudis]MDQ8935657.1 hypothetical protein [Acinetobacter rudis]MDQ8952072.1 hypothetical protein [Acinetobacter rudis]MDQ9017920.1 hypothetical protein [Acinetobacter rudis]
MKILLCVALDMHVHERCADFSILPAWANGASRQTVIDVMALKTPVLL